MNDMTLISFTSRATSSRLCRCSISSVSDLRFFALFGGSELIQVVVGGCVIVQSGWGEIPNQQWPSGRTVKQAGRRVGAISRLASTAEGLPGYSS